MKMRKVTTGVIQLFALTSILSLPKLARYHKQSWISQQSSNLTYQIRELESLVEKHYKQFKLPREYAVR